MKVRLTPAAEADVVGITSWYGERGHELDLQFLESLDQCLTSIGRNPRSCAEIHGEVRRALLRRFPYCVFYVIAGQEAVVLACLHGHRDPQVWKGRHA